ncbi:MAG: DNA polymerase III subunit gamma/tau [bacterium]
MYQVLARKYRPGIFDEIIGQDTIIQTLKNAVINDRISHAYIFSGTRGVGKTSIARILAKSINCINGPTVNPCGVCSACVQIQNGNSVDVIEIDGASNTGVDSIRDLKENIIYSPQSFKFKIYIIDEVHMLSNSAFNALLKTLEEPPAHAKFIFATTEIHKVPETILSRCQRFNFKRIPAKIIYEKLKEIAIAEDVSVDGENLMIIASLADGSLRDSLSIFDTAISYFGKNIKEDISSVLGLTNKAVIFNLISAIFKKDYENSIKFAKTIYDSGADVRQFMKQASFYIRNILVIKLKYKDLIYDLTDEEINGLIPLAEQKSAEELLDMIDIMLNADIKYQRISSPLLMLELTIFRLINIPSKHDVGELINKLGKFIGGENNRQTLAAGSPPGSKNLNGESRTKENLHEDKPYKPKSESSVSIEHEKLFDHFSKTDEKLNNQTAKPKIDDIIQINTADTVKENKAGIDNAQSIIDNIKEIFGSNNIERIDKK